MGITDLATLSAAWAAIAISVATALLAWRQNARIAELDRRQTLDVRQSEAVIHFTTRYHDLMRDGERFDDSRWVTQYWGQLSIEFFFFDRGWIPDFIYELWMIELIGRGYLQSPAAWESHLQQLVELYSPAYPRMTDFFLGLRELARQPFPGPALRNEAVVRYVRGYREQPAATGAGRVDYAAGFRWVVRKSMIRRRAS
ncbi:hypothetical protein GCM10023322_56670 [Rugosimonospora acidiphila]|uniref:DUF4760 domain-containing protein n=1 Tax=Rugosimonospora acidiphila TaxID=556531 RepID=A0ABP9SDI9_9ACTN